MQHQPANTDRNRRLNKLAGATVLGVQLADCRKRVNAEIERHRRAQAKARSPYASRFDLKPATTRQRVRLAVAVLRSVEFQIDEKYGRPAPALEVTAHLDGFALRYDGGVVDVYGSPFAAKVARLVAATALADLDHCLASAPSSTNRKAA